MTSKISKEDEKKHRSLSMLWTRMDKSIKKDSGYRSQSLC